MHKRKAHFACYKRVLHAAAAHLEFNWGKVGEYFCFVFVYHKCLLALCGLISGAFAALARHAQPLPIICMSCHMNALHSFWGSRTGSAAYSLWVFVTAYLQTFIQFCL